MAPVLTMLLLLLAFVAFIIEAVKNRPTINPLGVGLALWVLVQLLAIGFGPGPH